MSLLAPGSYDIPSGSTIDQPGGDQLTLVAIVRRLLLLIVLALVSPVWALEPGVYQLPANSAIVQPSGDRLVLVEGGLLTVPDPGSGMTISSAYEGGNGTNPVILDASTVQVDAEPDPGKGWTTPFDFEVTGNFSNVALTAKVRFAWGTATKFSGTPPDKMKPWYSMDGGATWARLTVVGYDTALQVLTLVTPPVTGQRIRIAEAPPYPMALYEADLARWQATDGKCTAAQIGASVNGYPIWRITATNSAVSDATKKRVYLTGEWHPQERFTSRRLRGMLDSLCGTSTLAAAIRNARIIHIVLRPNPDAVAAGWMRVNAQGIEMNRWSPAPDLAAEGPEQYAVHTDVLALAALTPGLRVFIDMHTSNAAGDYLATIDPALNTMNFWTYDGVHRLWQYPFTSVPGVPMSHKVVADTIPGVSTGYFDSADATYRYPASPNNLVTVASSEAVGMPIIRALDAWLQTH